MSFSEVHQRLDTICRRIAAGRRLARQLATALREHQLSEAEFRMLWLLRQRSAEREQAIVEQSVLVEDLGISAAQVSTIVEKLRCQQIIAPVADSNDRRRQLWRLTTSGHERLESVTAAVALLSRDWDCSTSGPINQRSQQEDAA